MQEERESIGDACPVRFSKAQELGAGGLVNGVVDEVVGLEAAAGNGSGVSGFEAEGGGLNKEVAISSHFGEVGGVDGVGREALAGPVELFGFEVGLEFLREARELVDGTVHEDELLTTFAGALGGKGLAGAASSSHDHDAEVADIDGKFLPNGAHEARAVGIEAEGLFAFPEEDGVDRSQSFRGGVEVGAGGKGFEFMRDGDVGADKAELAHFGECGRELSGLEF